MKLFEFAAGLCFVNCELAYVRVKFGDPCPRNSDFNIWGRCICNHDAYYDAEKNACLRNKDFSNWKKVNGYFSGYPLSIEHNRYDNKDEALDMCAKHEDCGGISQIGMGLLNVEQKSSSKRMVQFHSKSREISKVPFTPKMTSIQV